MIKRTTLILLLFCALAIAQGNGKYTILIVNDDGYDTTGIRALARALSDIGDVTIVGPRSNASGVGHGITYKTPVAFGRAENEGGIPVYWVDAKPASCTRWALDTLYADNKPDLVVSGINRGNNTGNGVYYSGTVAAAREATFLGISAMAVSTDMGSGTDYDSASKFVRDFCKELLKKDEFFFLNINFPAETITARTPVEYTCLTTARWPQSYDVRTNPRNNSTYFWIVNGPKSSSSSGTDQDAVDRGSVSITPLQVDLTDYHALEELKKTNTGEEKKDANPWW